MFRGTLGGILLSERQQLTPFINWQNTLYNDQPNDNAWEYFFERVSPIDNSDHKFIHGGQYFPPREYKTRTEMNRIIKKYVKIKSEIIEKLMVKITELGPNPLGVHIRMTDKFNCFSHGEPATGRPVGIDLYKKHIEKNLKEYNSNIFLATDDASVLDHMKIEYGDKIIATDSVRSQGLHSVHHHLKGYNRKKGQDVLIDCLLLSKCRHIIKGISNVGLCAMFWNVDLTSENLNSIYYNDHREDFVNKT